MVIVLKGNGEREEFNKGKVVVSCMRAGAPRELAERIAEKVERKLYNGIPTKKIMSMVKQELKKYDFKSYIKYPLKDAIASLNPEMHEFEHYVSKLFTYLGYNTKRSPEPYPQGMCIEHEIDVVIEKDGKIGIAECKHHYKDSTYTGLDPVMRQQARLQDLQEAYKKSIKNSINATSALVITNTSFSLHAIKYAKCKNIYLLSWKYSNKNLSLREIIEKYKAYPLTLFGLTIEERKKLIPLNILDSNDFIATDPYTIKKAHLSTERINEINERIKQILNNKR